MRQWTGKHVPESDTPSNLNNLCLMKGVSFLCISGGFYYWKNFQKYFILRLQRWIKETRALKFSQCFVYLCRDLKEHRGQQMCAIHL
jgi:hypothetical protein